MRPLALALVLLAACGADDDGPAIVFLAPGTEDPREAGAPLDVYLRPQGAFGTEVDIHVLGVEKDAIGPFEVSVLSAEGDVLARQPFLPTSTARELDGGCVAIAALPVVFLDSVPPAAVEDRPATLRAEMEGDRPADGEVAVVLRRID
jgi:hypothetical protein